MPRLFIAFELPSGLLDAIQEEIRRLKRTGADVRWSSRDHLHVTLRFLGEVPDAAILRVEEMLRTSCDASQPFEAVARGTGSFPGGPRPRVVWVGVQGTNDVHRAALHVLRRGIHEGSNALGFPDDRDDFTAHVTLGRVKGLGRSVALVNQIREDRDREFGGVEVKEVVLFRSQLGRGGSTYTVLKRAALGG
jgi:2'-5' RNA ligase